MKTSTEISDKVQINTELKSDDLICYCFGYTVNDIEQDFIKNERSLIIEKIAAEKKVGRCDCANKNPKGRWCLADVRQVVDRLKGKSSFNMISWKWFKGMDLGLMDVTQSNSIITLDGSLDPLRDRFNDNKDKIRFLSLLSPTCPLWRDQGARAVHENVFIKFPHEDISGSIVWIPILDDDSFDAAMPSVKFLNDRRVQHFYDKNKDVGKIIANNVGWAGNVAWDIYLFYMPFVEWTETPPKPVYWMHQLTDGWATKDKYRTGDGLKNELFISMEKLLS